eukprot:TRINITY_DN603_c0_g3_i8.p1 TRINITY_DN603_c0_g3~~TRINITY_DN603_c0_g3_i8.p1  ORF type:complete len:479 (+),score=81.13 TRINITY_DN603_c0_g3_i8:733-2169(+)
MKRSTSLILSELREGKTTCVELVNQYLSNIQRLNPKVNAVVTLNESLLDEAKHKDSLLKESKHVGPLHGLPIIVKDSIATKGIRTCSGSTTLVNNIPESDATVVHFLKKAGAIIIGKSNTPDPSGDIQTFNKVFGVTNNPFDLTRTPGGSSGGSACALACNMSSISIGSDIAGSLRIPASFCGVYSFKPTSGRVSLNGHIPPLHSAPIPSTELTIGPMSRDLEGLQIVTKVLFDTVYEKKEEVLENQSTDFLEHPHTPYRNVNPTSNLNLAFTLEFPGYPIDVRMREILENEITTKLKKAGINVTIFHPPQDFSANDIYEAHKVFATELVTSNKLQSPLKRHSIDPSPTSTQVNNAKVIRSKLRGLVHSILNNFDGWILPISSVLPFEHNPHHSSFQFPIKKSGGEISEYELSYWKANVSYSVPFSLTGNPVATLPVGSVNKLPFGIQVVGKRWHDEELLHLCKVIDPVIEHTMSPSL